MFDKKTKKKDFSFAEKFLTAQVYSAINEHDFLELV